MRVAHRCSDLSTSPWRGAEDLLVRCDPLPHRYGPPDPRVQLQHPRHFSQRTLGPPGPRWHEPDRPHGGGGDARHHPTGGGLRQLRRFPRLRQVSLPADAHQSHPAEHQPQRHPGVRVRDSAELRCEPEGQVAAGREGLRVVRVRQFPLW